MVLSNTTIIITLRTGFGRPTVLIADESPRKRIWQHKYEGCSKSFANRYTENKQSIGILFHL